MLTTAELARYGRQLLLPEVGDAGQARLAGARVLIVGAGGLGSPAASYLVAAGVGRVGIVDPDEVELSNLHRQLLHGTRDLGRPKVASASDRLRDVNPHVRVDALRTRVEASNADELLAGWDLVVDGSDNFPTRYLVNDTCVRLGIPTVYGSVSRFAGQLSVFGAAGGPCYRCLFPEPPEPGTVPSCAEGGVLGVLPGIIGAMQAAEALKLLLGIGEPLVGRLLVLDALTMRIQTIQVGRDPGCPVCSDAARRSAASGGPPPNHKIADECRPSVTVPPPAQAESRDAASTADITPRELSELLRTGAEVTLLDVREPVEWRIARLPGARLIPLATLGEAAPSLDADAAIVVYCHHGTRSDAAARWLRGMGFARVRNLEGGIDRWSREVDPGVPRY